jgi:hypothetical protein
VFGSHFEVPLDFLNGIPKLGAFTRGFAREQVLIAQILRPDQVSPKTIGIMV